MSPRRAHFGGFHSRHLPTERAGNREGECNGSVGFETARRIVFVARTLQVFVRTVSCSFTAGLQAFSVRRPFLTSQLESLRHAQEKHEQSSLGSLSSTFSWPSHSLAPFPPTPSFTPHRPRSAAAPATSSPPPGSASHSCCISSFLLRSSFFLFFILLFFLFFFSRRLHPS